jgi:hypothetical protein
MLDYKAIKQLAKENKQRINNYLVLSPQNDPFYAGSEAQRRDAEWVSKLYHDLLGSPEDVHIRRIHYSIVARGNVLKPNGMVYENTEKDWYYLENACKYARYLDLIPVSRFVDRRNPDPEINAKYWRNEDSILSELNVSDVVNRIVDGICPYNPQLTQAYHLELWCEKSTMNDILEPIASHYGANFITGMGELSITAVHGLIERVKRADRPARVFYISDFDPAGEAMPVSVSRKIEYYSRKYDDIPNIRLRQVVLTKEQCVEYKLPRTPIKDTDKRKDGFENRHGSGATELDALEALRPGELKKLITNELEQYFDSVAYYKVSNQNWEIRSVIRKQIREGISEMWITYP